jgi:hypothetical protein
MEVNNDKFGSRGRSEIKRGPTRLLAQPSKIAIKQLMPCCNRYNYGKREKEEMRPAIRIRRLLFIHCSLNIGLTLSPIPHPNHQHPTKLTAFFHA